MMIYIDTNILLRYLLDDDQKQSVQARVVFDDNNVFVLNEVLVEVMYVLNKVYAVTKSEIVSVLKKIVEKENVFFFSKEVIIKALSFYNAGIDPVDAILLGMNHVLNVPVHTFDKKIHAKLRKQ